MSTNKWHGGKGSKPRPLTDKENYKKNWDKIFGDISEKKKLNKNV